VYCESVVESALQVNLLRTSPTLGCALPTKRSFSSPVQGSTSIALIVSETVASLVYPMNYEMRLATFWKGYRLLYPCVSKLCSSCLSVVKDTN
jgi:hypothetical protein